LKPQTRVIELKGLQRPHFENKQGPTGSKTFVQGQHFSKNLLTKLVFLKFFHFYRCRGPQAVREMPI